MAIYSFTREQIIPASIDKVWDFFSSPENLARITPPQLKFTVTSKHHGDHIYPGQIIEYTVSPLLGIPLYWMTEITHVQEKIYFADEQRYGPYKLWHHQHHFRSIDNNTVEMKDIVHYKLPLWFLGDLANALFVRKQLNEIFAYRLSVTEALFGGK